MSIHAASACKKVIEDELDKAATTGDQFAKVMTNDNIRIIEMVTFL